MQERAVALGLAGGESRATSAGHARIKGSGGGARGVMSAAGRDFTPVKMIVDGDNYEAGKKLGAGLDFGGDGGSLVLPPSRHASGRAYESEASSHLDDMPLAPMPTWRLARLRDHRTMAAVTGQPTGVGASHAPR